MFKMSTITFNAFSHFSFRAINKNLVKLSRGIVVAKEISFPDQSTYMGRSYPNNFSRFGKMRRAFVVLENIVARLRREMFSSNTGTHFEALEEKYQTLLPDFNEISSSLEHITKHYFSDPASSEWKYILTVLYFFKQIGNIVTNTDELLSVKELKSVKDSIAQLVELGILTKLLPKLPFYIYSGPTKTDDIFYQYNILKCTLLALCDFLKNDHLRVLVLSSESLRAILTGLYQIAYCPLKKNFDLVFTEVIYQRLLNEKDIAVKLLNNLKDSIYPSIYIKETMIIFRENSPPWFKKAVSQMLTSIMLGPKGIENISVTLLDGIDDTAKTWQTLDVIYRLILSCKNQLDFRENICQQVVTLADKADDTSLVFERLFVICTKKFYLGEEELAKNIFLRYVVTQLLRFTIKDYVFDDGICTENLKKSVRLLHAIFAENSAENPNLPVHILKPVLGVIFRIYSMTISSVLKATNEEAKELLIKYLTDIIKEDNIIFDCFLFGICDCKKILPFRKDLILYMERDNINVKVSEHAVMVSTADNSESLLKLLENNSILLTRWFRYLLRCLTQKEKYFKKSNDGLLGAENAIMNEYFERSLVVFNVLSILADNKNIQKAIIEAPKEIIDFVKSVLRRAIGTGIHTTTEYESDGFQTFFTVTMILNALMTDYSEKDLQMFRVLEEPLKTIQITTKHMELAGLIEKILSKIESIERCTKMHIEETKSDLDIILEDICDPLLPVRGHGLMALRKLVEKNDASVREKKQYILTIFQQNLKNDDSYIYLNAVDGLAAMANMFSDIVINSLCEEFSDFSRKGEDGHEVRIKLGEVLVKVTKTLGDMAPKYKSVLLNTFLMGTRDEDHLVRASSLSNLGEICRVLSYKLGTVVTEVLVCVHAIITTDKAIEARRAAVTVIRQLLVGLESEMIAFLKDDILPIYRTLKQVYHDDKDDVMRLQAQLALEELNENMKHFVFPKQQLSAEKKIIMLD